MKTKRIVVIHNDARVLDMIKEALNYEGFKVEIFESTNDIIGLVKQSKPDLLILDYILVGVNGGELCRELKKNKSTAHIPVIMCSAYPRVLKTIGSYDSDAFLAKPFDLTELITTVSQLLAPKIAAGV